MSEQEVSDLPLEWVRAFEAAGRTGSFTSAASETGLTQSAISQRIGHLEKRIGAKLFIRGPRGVVLTVDGETWLPYVTSALRMLRQSADDLFVSPRQRLTVSVSASVQELWIAPRLHRMSKFPDMQLAFKSMVLASEASAQEAPLRIRYGTAEPGRRLAAPLFEECVSPVAAPSLLTKGTRWQDLPRIALSGPRPSWSEWVARSGDPAVPIPMIRFDTFSAALAAARAGHGVLLGSLPLCEEDLRTGRLQRLSKRELTGQSTYWLFGDEGSVTLKQWSRLLAVLTDPVIGS